jgi:hypothetical protein
VEGRTAIKEFGFMCDRNKFRVVSKKKKKTFPCANKGAIKSERTGAANAGAKHSGSLIKGQEAVAQGSRLKTKARTKGFRAMQADG